MKDRSPEKKQGKKTPRLQCFKERGIKKDISKTFYPFSIGFTCRVGRGRWGERTRNERGSTYFRARRGSVHGLIYRAVDKGLTRSLTAQIFVLRISKLPQIQGRGTRSSSYSEERRKSGSVLRKISRRPDVDAPAIAILLLSLSLSFSLSLCPFFNPFSVEILFFLRDRNQLGIRNSKIS